jgi:hypothetical protein
MIDFVVIYLLAVTIYIVYLKCLNYKDTKKNESGICSDGPVERSGR